jgi:hypothetical protein
VKLAIGLLLTNGFPVPAPFVLGLADLLAHVVSGQGNQGLSPDRQITNAHVISSQGFPIDTARNDVCRLFLDQSTSDALLFLDADMRHPPTLPHRLVGHGLDVVSGRYQMRKPPFHTVAMRKVGSGPNDYKAIDQQAGLAPVDAGGAGALFITRRVLVAMRARVGDDWFRYQVGPTGLRTVSEDMWFYEQAKACGFQAYVDLDAHCTHVAQFEVDAQWSVPFREAYAKATQPVNIGEFRARTAVTA